MKRAVIYCRVSTKEQTENLSLETQRAACVAYCEREGIDIDDVFVEEGESAKTADRPVLARMLAHCATNRSRVDYVVVYRLDRLSRQTSDYHAIRVILSRDGVEIRSASESTIDSTPHGKLAENMIAAIAQFDNDVRADRTVTGMKAALSHGRWTHRAPLGYKNANAKGRGPSLIPDPDRAPLVVEAFQLYGSGTMCKAEVLNVVTSRGLRTRRGNTVGPQQFDCMLRNPLYVGQVVSPQWGIEAEGDFEPLIDRGLFDRVQVLLAGGAGPVVQHRLDRPEFPLRRFVRCAACGTPLTACWSKGKSGKRYAYYYCRNPECRAVKARKARIEATFARELEALAVGEPVVRLFRATVEDLHRARRSETQQDAEKLDKRLEELRGRKQKLVDTFVYKQAIDSETYQQELDRLNGEIAQVEFELASADRSNVPDLAHALDVAEEVLLDPAGTWHALQPGPRLRFQWLVFPDGLEFDGEIFRTPVTAPVFRVLQATGVDGEGLASPTGFEPVLPP